MQAVVKIGKSQYLIEPGQELLVDRPQIDGVLLVTDGDKTTVGQPLVSSAKVTFEELGEVKGDKIRVSKFKAKSRYRKTVGFRAHFTKIKIKTITV